MGKQINVKSKNGYYNKYEAVFETDGKEVLCDEYEIVFSEGPGYQNSHKVHKTKDGKWIRPLIPPSGSPESLLEDIRKTVDQIES